LTSDGIYRSSNDVAQRGSRLPNQQDVADFCRILNLLDSRDHDIDYAYTSRITPTATPAFTDVFHPVEPFQVRKEAEPLASRLDKKRGIGLRLRLVG
jgi:hypothetical protein